MSHIDEHGQHQEAEPPKVRGYSARTILWVAAAIFVPYAVIWWAQ